MTFRYDENNKDAVQKRRHAYGEKNGHSRLTAADIREIRKSPKNQEELAILYGIDQSHVSNIIHRKVWRHVE